MAKPSEFAAPRGFLLMSVGDYGEDDGSASQSFIMSGNRGSTPLYVSREQAELIRAFARRDIPPKQRARYDEWVQRSLGNGGVFLRLELEMVNDQIHRNFMILRDGRVEPVEPPADTALAVAVLYDVPIYIDIAWLKAVGGWGPEYPH